MFKSKFVGRKPNIIGFLKLLLLTLFVYTVVGVKCNTRNCLDNRLCLFQRGVAFFAAADNLQVVGLPLPRVGLP